MKTPPNLPPTNPAFWPKWFGKLLFTLISVKVWGLVAGTIVSTWLLMLHMHHKPVIVGETVIEYGINGAQWVTFNTTIWALIFGMKEIFRISEQHDNAEQDYLRENLNSRMKIAGMNSCDGPECETTQSAGQYEIVGHDPHEL
jgi:hypothetical protein